MEIETPKVEVVGDPIELFKALNKFQAEVKGAKKNRTNPHFKNDYSDLEACWDATREPLSKHGLFFQQHPVGDDGLTSMLGHVSGSYITSTMRMKSANDKPQTKGSTITYMRRYAKCGILGIAQTEDDDANQASGVTTQGKGVGSAKQATQSQAKPKAPTRADVVNAIKQYRPGIEALTKEEKTFLADAMFEGVKNGTLVLTKDAVLQFDPIPFGG